MKIKKKVPFQIYLEPEQERMIENISRQTNKSKAAVIRLCITQFLETLPLEDDPAMKIIDLGDSGKTDISDNHDEYLFLMELEKQ